jgi:hypothetical protein
MTEWLRNLWCDNPTGLLAGAASGIMVWAATYAVAKPISHIREKRLEALTSLNNMVICEAPLRKRVFGRPDQLLAI